MNELLKITLVGLFFGTFGTTIGGIIGISKKNVSNKMLGFILSLASGLMTSVVCFDLIPEAFEISDIKVICFGVILGLLTLIMCDIVVKNKFKFLNKSSLLKTGIIVSIGLAIHNLPEGLAIGSGFYSSLNLGTSIAITIAMHDIPEGISMAVPLKNGGMNKKRVIILVILSGITTGVGAFIGGIVGGISKEVISICLSFAAGAMIYIVMGELIPEANKLYNGRLNYIGNIIGIIFGLFAILIR